MKGVTSLVKSRFRGQVEGLQVLRSLELDLARYIYIYISSSQVSLVAETSVNISDAWLSHSDLRSVGERC